MTRLANAQAREILQYNIFIIKETEKKDDDQHQHS